jgi:hypothetical protein
MKAQPTRSRELMKTSGSRLMTKWFLCVSVALLCGSTRSCQSASQKPNGASHPPPRYEAPRGEDAGDVVRNFHNYVKDYLRDRGGLTPDESRLLVCDPELGKELDVAKSQWLWHDLSDTEDPDTFLVPRLYDAPQMQRINSILDRYAREYPVREEPIRQYLKSIGHPLGS